MRIFFCLFICIAFFSCEIKVKTGTSAEEDATGSKIRNHVELKNTGLKVEQAFLVFEDGKLVPDDNKIEIGQQVKLRLVIHGWEVEDDKVKVGAAEHVLTSDGQSILTSDDLFSPQTEEISKEEAEIISISATITNIDKLYDYFLVEFRVWDKQKPGNEVTGSYKLYLK